MPMLRNGYCSDVIYLCEGLGFTEGPVALPDGSVLFVDIAARTLNRASESGQVSVVATLGGGPNGVAIGPDGAAYVCNNGGAKTHKLNGRTLVIGAADDYAGGRIERVDLRTGKFERLYDACDGVGLKAPNDLVFDRQGGFYFTDLGKTRHRDRDRGGIYYALPDGSAIREVAFPLHTPNGIGLSPDEQTLYVAETETARLWSYRILSPGVVEHVPHPSPDFPAPNGATLVYGAGGFQRFDSLKVEANGFVCVGTIHYGGITVVDPASGLSDHVPLAETHVTNLCFGGPDQMTVYASLSTTGRIAKLRWPRPGLKLNFVDRAG